MMVVSKLSFKVVRGREFLLTPSPSINFGGQD